MANQYGIDVGNVLSKGESIKTMKYNREAAEQKNSLLEQERQSSYDEAQRKKGLAQSTAKESGVTGDFSTIDEVEKVTSMIEKMDKIQLEKTKRTIETTGKYALALANMKEPEKQKEMFEQFKLNAPKEVSDKMPKEYNQQWAVKAALDAKKYSDIINEQVAKTKNENSIKLEGIKQKGKEKLKTLEQKIPKKNKKEFEQIMDILDNPNLSKKKRKFYEARLTKLSQTDRTSLLINMNTVKDAQSNFASKLGLNDPYELSTIDTRSLSPEQQAEANQIASVIIKGLGANAKLAEKKMGEYSAMAGQMEEAMSNYENVGSFRLADETTKKYFSNYFGLSEEELQSTEAAMAFQSMLNIKIKADSGSAVSGNEMVRNTLETATPFMDKDRILLGIKNVAKRQMATLEGLKKVMGPIAFNLKYGSVLNNYKDIISAAKSESKGDREVISSKTPQAQEVTAMSDEDLMKLIGQ